MHKKELCKDTEIEIKFEKKLSSCTDSIVNNLVIETGFPCVPTIWDSNGGGRGRVCILEWCLFNIMA